MGEAMSKLEDKFLQLKKEITNCDLQSYITHLVIKQYEMKKFLENPETFQEFYDLVRESYEFKGRRVTYENLETLENELQMELRRAMIEFLNHSDLFRYSKVQQIEGNLPDISKIKTIADTLQFSKIQTVDGNGVKAVCVYKNDNKSEELIFHFPRLPEHFDVKKITVQINDFVDGLYLVTPEMSNGELSKKLEHAKGIAKDTKLLEILDDLQNMSSRQQAFIYLKDYVHKNLDCKTFFVQNVRIENLPNYIGFNKNIAIPNILNQPEIKRINKRGEFFMDSDCVNQYRVSFPFANGYHKLSIEYHSVNFSHEDYKFFEDIFIKKDLYLKLKTQIDLMNQTTRDNRLNGFPLLRQQFGLSQVKDNHFK